MSPRAKRRNPVRPIPGEPVKPIPGKPVPVIPVILWRSPNHFRTSILHKEGQTPIYEAIGASSYGLESKDDQEIGQIISMGLSLPPNIKLRYVSFKYTTTGDSYIHSVSVTRATQSGEIPIYDKGDLSLKNTSGAIYQTSFLEDASVEGAITLSMNLVFPSKNKRTTIGTIKIVAVED